MNSFVKPTSFQHERSRRHPRKTLHAHRREAGEIDGVDVGAALGDVAKAEQLVAKRLLPAKFFLVLSRPRLLKDHIDDLRPLSGSSHHCFAGPIIARYLDFLLDSMKTEIAYPQLKLLNKTHDESIKHYDSNWL